MGIADHPPRLAIQRAKKSAPVGGLGGGEEASDDEQTFSGNGGKSLGTINVSEDSMLEWTNDGTSFQDFSAERVPVNSQAKSGDTVLTKGKCTDLQVNAVGNWTIKIRPR